MFVFLQCCLLSEASNNKKITATLPKIQPDYIDYTWYARINQLANAVVVNFHVDASLVRQSPSQQESPLPLTDPCDAVAQRVLNIPHRIMW